MSYPFEDNHEIICHCMGVEHCEIKKAIYDGRLTEVSEVTDATRAGGGCHSCHGDIAAIIDETWILLEKEGHTRP